MIQRFMKSQTNSSVNAYVPEMVRRLRSLEAKAFLLSNPATLVGKDAAVEGPHCDAKAQGVP